MSSSGHHRAPRPSEGRAAAGASLGHHEGRVNFERGRNARRVILLAADSRMPFLFEALSVQPRALQRGGSGLLAGGEEAARSRLAGNNGTVCPVRLAGSPTSTFGACPSIKRHVKARAMGRVRCQPGGRWEGRRRRPCVRWAGPEPMTRSNISRR